MRTVVFPAVALLLAGCSLTPRLEKPALPIPAVYSRATPGDAKNGADLVWREMFGDLRLQRLIALALIDSRDLRIAALNVEAARARFRTQRGALLPAADGQGSYTRQRIPSSIAGASVGLDEAVAGPNGFEFEQFSAQAALTSFEIDLFGRLRSLTHAALERYLAMDEARQSVQIALVGAIADAYLAERLAEEQLRLTERTLEDWRASLDLTHRLHAASQTSGLEVSQAEGLVYQAEADLEARKRTLDEASNALQSLVGAPLPADLPPPIPLMDQPIHADLPAGLPSALLLHRPDIRQAEHELNAANADVGAARAAFFPRISLTAAFGFSSLALANLFNGDNRNWSFSPIITAPIFHRGRLRQDLDLAKIRRSITVANYERAIQAAFREVSDGLAGQATFKREFEAQAKAAAAAHRRTQLSTMRYHVGADSRLELLDAQRTEYKAQQNLLEVKYQSLSSAVALYRALGGGILISAEK